MSEEDESVEVSKLRKFVQNLTQVPCMRKSLLTGISGGLGSGLVFFLFTSNVRKATNIGVGSYAVIATSMWIYCRYHFTLEERKRQELKKALQTVVKYDGSDRQAAIDASQLEMVTKLEK